MRTTRERTFGISSFTLKIIAIISMTADHIYKVLFFFHSNMAATILGRLAFPIFCFLLVEGFFHTGNVRRYGIRLFLFALISEIPFDLAFYRKLYAPGRQNIFFTLLIGLLMMWAIERLKERGEHFTYICLLLACAAAYVLRVDYSAMGIVLIFLFYFFRQEHLKRNIMAGLLNILSGYSQVYGVIALIPIELYNGKRGPRMKYFFYLFYPGHLLILYFMRIGWI